MHSEEILCSNEIKENCKQYTKEGGYSIKKTDECSGLKHIEPCDPEIDNARNGTRLNALEPLNKIIQECEKKTYKKKPTEYQCPSFSISYTGNYDFRRALINIRSENFLERIQYRLEVPTNPLPVEHYAGMIGPDPVLMIYRNKSSLLQFFEDARKAIASEALTRKRGAPYSREGIEGCIRRM